LDEYLAQKCIPGGTNRNWASYGHKINEGPELSFRTTILADPQTSGGLLVSVSKKGYEQVVDVLNQSMLNYFTEPIGEIVKLNSKTIMVY
jgi:selenide,water dikinase